MPPRSQKPAKSTGAPTWIVTFGDLMSLLFALFVLLFSYSTVDAEKYKALAGSLREAFGSTKEDAFVGDQGGPIAIIDLAPGNSEAPEEQSAKQAVIEPEAPNTNSVSPTDEITQPPPQQEADISTITEKSLLQAARETRELYAKRLEKKLADVILTELAGSRIEVEREKEHVQIRFPNEIAFSAGSAKTTQSFQVVLRNLAKILGATPGKIVVSGHTDNVPVAPGGTYESNWELSAARAAAVVHVILENQDIASTRVTIQGFADSRPLAENDSAEHRALNRRVEISIQIDISASANDEMPQ